MDIAKLMKISERSVTRLLYGKKEMTKAEYEEDVVEEVERLLAEKEKILNPDISSVVDLPVQTPAQAPRQPDDAKRKLGTNLLAMKVKNKDIANMLDVSEKTVQRWKARMSQQELEDGDDDEDEDVAVKEENDDQFDENEIVSYGEF